MTASRLTPRKRNIIGLNLIRAGLCTASRRAVDFATASEPGGTGVDPRLAKEARRIVANAIIEIDSLIARAKQND